MAGTSTCKSPRNLSMIDVSLRCLGHSFTGSVLFTSLSAFHLVAPSGSWYPPDWLPRINSILDKGQKGKALWPLKELNQRLTDGSSALHLWWNKEMMLQVQLPSFQSSFTFSIIFSASGASENHVLLFARKAGEGEGKIWKSGWILQNRGAMAEPCFGLSKHMAVLHGFFHELTKRLRSERMVFWCIIWKIIPVLPTGFSSPWQRRSFAKCPVWVVYFTSVWGLWAKLMEPTRNRF